MANTANCALCVKNTQEPSGFCETMTSLPGSTTPGTSTCKSGRTSTGTATCKPKPKPKPKHGSPTSCRPLTSSGTHYHVTSDLSGTATCKPKPKPKPKARPPTSSRPLTSSGTHSHVTSDPSGTQTQLVTHRPLGTQFSGPTSLTSSLVMTHDLMTSPVTSPSTKSCDDF